MSRTSLSTHIDRTGGVTAIRAASLLCAALVIVTHASAQAADFWRGVARSVYRSSVFEARSDYHLARAKAAGLPTREEIQEALDEAAEELREQRELAREQLEARLDAADALGEEDGYDPVIDPEDFVELIDNPYLPLTPGLTYVYEGETEDGTERVEVTVTDDTKEILGVACTVVRDTVTVDDELVEDTHDWFAQDVDGNVWYFGEASFEYEDGDPVSMEGSWRAGVDGAKPGIVMKANPAVDDFYRQEFDLGEAEDLAGVTALDESADVPFGFFTDCLQTFETTPIEPDVAENKYYAPGVGLVLEVDLETGERVELVEIRAD